MTDNPAAPEGTEQDQIDTLIAKARPKKSSEAMQRAFHERCRWVEATLKVRAEAEIAMRAENFSSGTAIEAIFRDELSKILPRRYQVTCGKLSDRNGMTVGDCDVVIFNDTWFPTIKERATTDDRQHVMPVEGAYAVIEVKQTLSEQTLDDALGKLISCHRLHRPSAGVNQITENRGFDNQVDRIGNPLFSAVLATRLESDVTLQQLVARFIAVNRRLDRSEMVHCLCVLGEACFFWGWVPPGSTEARVATFFGPEDLSEPLMLILATPSNSESPLGAMISRLFGHVTNSVLSDATDIPHHYGIGQSLMPFLGGTRFIEQVVPVDEL